MSDRVQSNRRVLKTDAWILSIPDEITENSPLLTVATVHPRGDQRVVRCAQSAVDAGYRIHFIWLGSGDPSTDPVVRETLLPKATRTRHRLMTLPRIYRLARASGATAGHIHDFYFLPFALSWKRSARISMLYDVHEFYDIYYASRFRWPLLSAAVRFMVNAFQTQMSRHLDGVNVVSQLMDEGSHPWKVPVAVTPNFPHAGRFIPPSADSDHRHQKAISTGTLHMEYGMDVLIQVARELQRTGSKMEITVVERFHDAKSRDQFHALLNQSEPLDNVKLVQPVPAHELPGLLDEHGIGLSIIPPVGQWGITVPTKLYEYILSGMVVVGTDLPAQTNFCREFGVGRFAGYDPLSLANALAAVSADLTLFEMARDRAKEGRDLLTWERVSNYSLEPLLRSMRRP